MRVLLDTNVLLDALVIDRPDQSGAARLIQLAEEERLTALVTPMALCTLLYMLQKGPKREGPTLQRIRSILKYLVSVLKLVEVKADHFDRSADSTFLDIEDGVQYFSTIGSGRLDAIITRDKDFIGHVDVPLMTAAEFLDTHESKLIR